MSWITQVAAWNYSIAARIRNMWHAKSPKISLNWTICYPKLLDAIHYGNINLIYMKSRYEYTDNWRLICWIYQKTNIIRSNRTYNFQSCTMSPYTGLPMYIYIHIHGHLSSCSVCSDIHKHMNEKYGTIYRITSCIPCHDCLSFLNA